MTNEPTTGEIVRALRNCAYSHNLDGCSKCRYDDELISNCLDVMETDAADRLESQERTIAELKYQLELLSLGIPVQMKEITDRAESAKRERDELVDLIPHTCNTCYFQSKNLLNEEPCVSCRIYSKWTWRGLPQDGEKRNG